MATTVTLHIGPITIVDLERHVVVEEETIKRRERSTGLAHLHAVTGPDFEVEIADMKFDNGTRDVRMFNRRDAASLDRLTHGFRIGVHQWDPQTWFMQLRVPAVGLRGTETAHQTTVEDLNLLCRFDTRTALVEAGATAVNRRELALGDKGRARNELCTAFDSEYSPVPVVAYAITPLFTYARLFG